MLKKIPVIFLVVLFVSAWQGAWFFLTLFSGLIVYLWHDHIKSLFMLKKIPVIFLVVLFVCAWQYEGDYWHTKWFVLLVLLSLHLGIVIGKAFRSVFAGAWFFLTLYSGLIVFGWHDNMYSPFPRLHQLATESDSAYSIVAFLLILFSVLNLKIKYAKKLEYAFGYVSLLSSALIVLHFLRGKMTTLSTGGFFDQGSMEGVFIAVCYPFLAYKREKLDLASLPQMIDAALCAYLPWVAVLALSWKAEASVPLVLMAVGVLVNFWFEPSSTTLRLSRSLKIALGVFGIALCLFIGSRLNPNFYDSSSRFRIYKLAWSLIWAKELTMPISNDQVAAFIDPDFWLFGLGQGTFSYWMRTLQENTGTLPHAWFLWAHSDFLQVWFEQGIAGLFLCIATGLHAFKRALDKKAHYLAESLAIYGASMVFQFPFHLPVHAFLGLFLLVMCFTKDIDRLEI